MAASVQVLCPNGRRQTVKITPNTKILQILEEVCQRQGFIPPESYKLIQGRKELDLSLSVRFSSLPNNAKLELAKSTTSRTEEDVTIALQLDSGQRVQDCFPPSVALWDLLLHFEEKHGDCKGKLTQVETRDDKAFHPVCIFMREEVIGEQALKATTLKKLALTSGKAIIRLLHRPVDENIIADICDQVEKDKAKQAKLEEIGQKKKEMMDEIEREENLKTAMKEKLSKVPEDMDIGATETKEEPQKQSPSTKPRPSQEQQGRRDRAVRVERQPELMDVDREDDTLSSTSMSESSSRQRSSKTKTSASSSSQPHRHPPNPMDALRNLNIPGVEIYTPDDFSDLSPAEQAIARRLAQRFMPHLQAAATSQTTDGATRVVHGNYPQHEQSDDAFLNFKFPEETKGKDLSTGSSSSSGTSEQEPCERKALVYNPSEALSVNSQEVPEDFFEVTQSDVRLLYRDLQSNLQNLEDQPLMTETMRKANAETAYDQYDRVVIRIHFPDKVVLQGCFRPRETVQALHTFVRECLQDKKLKFYLYTTPPKTILRDMKSSLAVNQLAPAALVYFGCDQERDSYIREDLLTSMTSRLDAETAVAEVLKTENKDQLIQNSGSSTNMAGPSGMSRSARTFTSPSSSSATLPSGAKVPKWLKLGKK